MKRSPMSRRPKARKPRLKLEIPKATGQRIDGGKKPWRSEAYKAHVRTFACLACPRPAEHAHHIRECFPRTMGVRISDAYVVPLCEKCHSLLHARSSTFWTERHVTPDGLRTWCESVHAGWRSKP